MDRVHLGYVYLGSYGVVDEVRESREGDVGDHLHYLLVAVSGFPDVFEGFVGDVRVVLDYFLDKPKRCGAALVLGLEALRPLTLFLAEALLLRHGGVDRQSILAAVVVRDRNRDGFLRLTVQCASLESPGEVHVSLHGFRRDGHLLEEVDDLTTRDLLALLDQWFGFLRRVIGRNGFDAWQNCPFLHSWSLSAKEIPVLSYV